MGNRKIVRTTAGHETCCERDVQAAGRSDIHDSQRRLDVERLGVTTANTRFQPNPGFTAGDVPRLKLKWAFGFPGDLSANAQPVIAAGRVFVGSPSGTVYALDASN